MKKCFVLVAVFTTGQSYFEPIISVFASTPTEEQKEAALYEWSQLGMGDPEATFTNMYLLETSFHE